MNNAQILQIALNQSAADSSCHAEDFLIKNPKTVISKKNNDARKYLKLPFLCDLTSYGSNVVASVSPDLYDIVTEYINSYPPEHCFETPNLHVLMDQLRQFGLDICFMAQYFLPDINSLKINRCGFETRIITKNQFQSLYLPQWSNALCKERSELDKIAIGAYDNDTLIGLAGASADCKNMWQIGIDVLPQYRKQGIACALTTMLAQEILKLGKVPFYCCAWSNVASARNAVKSGFRPAWVQVTAQKKEFIDNLNKSRRD